MGGSNKRGGLGLTSKSFIVAIFISVLTCCTTEPEQTKAYGYSAQAELFFEGTDQMDVFESVVMSDELIVVAALGLGGEAEFGQISCFRVPDTEIIRVQCLGNDSSLLVAFLDTLIQLTGKAMVAPRYDSIQELLLKNEQELDSVVALLNTNGFFEEVVVIETQIRDLKLRLEGVERIEQYILDGDKEDQLLPPSFYVGEDEFLLELLNRWYLLKMDILRVDNDMESAYDDETLKQRNAALTDLENDILTYLDNSRVAIDQRLEEHEELSEESVEELQRHLGDQGRAEWAATDDHYYKLLEERAQLEIAPAGIFVPFKIISPIQVIKNPR